MDGNKFGGYGIALCDNTTTVDDKAFNYLISDVNCANSDLNALENTENKISSDLLYYDWPEIGNFEDVDRMFRSCDSIFGLGVSKEDELSWLSSADDLGLGGPEDLLNSNTKFFFPEPNIAEHISENRAFNRGCSVNDSTGNARDSSWNFVTGPAIVDNNGFNPLEQIDEQKTHMKPHNEPNGEGKGCNFQNGSLRCNKGLPNEAIQPSFPNADMRHFSQCPNPISNTHSDNSLMSDLTSVNLKPSILRTPGQLHCMKGCSDNPPLEVSGQWKKLHSRQGSRSSVNSSGVTKFHPVSGVTSATPPELGSLNLQKISDRDNQSLEVASFRQLQLVMKQLDLQTKLCIRDSLYRLARNATKRRDHANPNPSIRPEEAKSFMDMETGTNPIDRSIAHLLFHQSSSSAPGRDSFPCLASEESSF